MSYQPSINDYVTWTKGVEGWVYFVDKEYITIETNVWEKSKESYEHSPRKIFTQSMRCSIESLTKNAVNHDAIRFSPLNGEFVEFVLI